MVQRHLRAACALLATAVLLGAGTATAVLIGGATTTTPAVAATPSALSQAQYLALAKGGIAKISKWWDPKLHWYLSYLGDHKKHPLGSIWDTVSTLELLSETAIAQPSNKNRAAVKAFANYYQHYWDPNLKPVGGYAPYPGDRGSKQTTWYDDAGWLGLAFLDADKGLGAKRYLGDAERAMEFILAGGWDVKQGGGMWWDTKHPWRSNEALAADADLAARLYQATGKRAYLEEALKLIAWANKHLRTSLGVYIQTNPNPYGSLTYTGSGPSGGGTTFTGGGTVTGPPGCVKTKGCTCHEVGTTITCTHGGGGGRSPSAPATIVAMPHDGEGAMLSAMVTLYQSTHQRSWLNEAETFAGAIIKYLEPLQDGPQYDGILMRGFVTLYAQDHNVRWYDFLASVATIVIEARTAPGVYLKPWGGDNKFGGGSEIPSAVPNMLRSDASSVMFFADMATVKAPK
jgi:glycosyl hydrolase family 76